MKMQRIAIPTINDEEKIEDLYVANIAYLSDVHFDGVIFKSFVSALLSTTVGKFAIVKLNKTGSHGINVLTGESLPRFRECINKSKFAKFLDDKIDVIDTCVPLWNVINQFSIRTLKDTISKDEIPDLLERINLEYANMVNNKEQEEGLAK